MSMQNEQITWDKNCLRKYTRRVGVVNIFFLPFVCVSLLSFYYGRMIRSILACIIFSFLLSACTFANSPATLSSEVVLSTGAYEKDMSPEKRLETTKSRRKESVIIRKGDYLLSKMHRMKLLHIIFLLLIKFQMILLF